MLDNLERALRSPGSTRTPTATGREPERGGLGPDALARGRPGLRELRAALERAGVEAYDPAGEQFDPAWHEALSTQRRRRAPSPGPCSRRSSAATASTARCCARPAWS